MPEVLQNSGLYQPIGAVDLVRDSTEEVDHPMGTGMLPMQYYKGQSTMVRTQQSIGRPETMHNPQYSDSSTHLEQTFRLRQT